MQRLSQAELSYQPVSRGEIIYKTFVGNVPAQLIEQISALRIRCFREYPHCYDGSRDNAYEKLCAEELTRSRHTIVVAAFCDEAFAGFGTAFPLPAADVVDKESMAALSGCQLEDCFYFSEGVIAPEFRGYTLATHIYHRIESQALQWGYRHGCLAKIVREEDDPRKPAGYRDRHSWWRRMGYTRTDIPVEYWWPTLLVDGSSQYLPNKMLLWIKPHLRARRLP